jgi:hypothetical protein
VKLRVILFLALLLTLLPWIVISGNFIYPRYSEYSDLTISHIPNAIYLLDSLKTYGEIPHWTGAIYSGYPFSANPLAGIWYLPGWLAYLFPLHVGFNLVVLLHIFWGGYGMFRLLRNYRLHPVAAITGAIAFCGMPKIFAHFAAGHITLIYAICWTPWLLVVAQRQTAGVDKPKAKWVLPGTVLGLIVLADVRWFAYAIGLWILYLVNGYIVDGGRQQLSKQIIKTLSHFIINLTVAIGLSAGLILGLIQYLQFSTRDAMQASDVLVYSLPVEKTLGLMVPDFGGFAEWVIYPGALGLLLCIYCLAIPQIRKRTWFWLIILTGSLLVSLGELFPFMAEIVKLPGLNLLRVPPRAMFIGGLAICVLVGFGIDDLFSRKKPSIPDPVFFMAPFAGFVVMLAVGIQFISGNTPMNMLWGGLAMCISIGLIALEERKHIPRSFGFILFPLLLLIDMTGTNLQAIKIINPSMVYTEKQQLAEWLDQQEELFRIYTPSNSLPQLTAAVNGVEMANGIDPLQIKYYTEYMRIATGISFLNYSVTIPPFQHGDPYRDNIGAIPDATMLGFLNVKYLISEYPIVSPGWQQVRYEENSWIYQNDKYRPRVWTQSSETVIDDAWQTVTIREQKPGQISLEVEGPGVVVVSEVYYPGWEASVNGEPVEKLRVANILIGVEIENGINAVSFVYKPVLLSSGLIISTIFWLLLIIFLTLKWIKKT